MSHTMDSTESRASKQRDALRFPSAACNYSSRATFHDPIFYF